MPEFEYTARELSGQKVTGLLSASNEKDAIATLSARQLFPLRIDLAESAKSQQKQLGRRVRSRHVSLFYSQLSDLLKSGVPLLRSLNLLERQASNVALKCVLQEVRDSIADGKRLAEAMAGYPRVFPELAVSMVRAGEEGGFLEEVLKRVARFTDHQEDLKSRVIGAIAYPLFLLVAGTLVVTAMMIWFVPKFEPIFTRLEARGELPWATTTLISISDLIGQHGLLVLAVVALAIGFAWRYTRTEAGREMLDYWRLRVWGAGPIIRSLAIARFCRILGTLLYNGVPILQSLRIAKDATGNRVLSAAIADAADNISTGKALAKPLGASGEFPEQIVEMIAVGEEANNLEQVLIDISDNMERNTYRQLELFVRLLEPVMLLMLAAGVLFVVMGLLLPVFQSSGAV